MVFYLLICDLADSLVAPFYGKIAVQLCNGDNSHITAKYHSIKIVYQNAGLALGLVDILQCCVYMPRIVLTIAL